ncbi:MAG TPA: rubredoxin [Cytophagales bacterium]|nr:rubredoxin [Cytophagales bacterium]
MNMKPAYEKSDLVRVFVKGGMLSPADLYKIAQTAESLGASYLHFGSRQDLLFPIHTPDPELLEQTFSEINTLFEYSEAEQYQNVVSSYVAYNMLPSTGWVHEDTYYYALSAFDYRPKLKINVTDPAQAMVPLFSGEINFVASPYDNYWFLYLRLPGKPLKEWPDLIYSLDMPGVAQAIEENQTWAEGKTVTDLWEKMREEVPYNAREKDVSLLRPSSVVPDYEGMNQMVGGRYWLGLYWRDNQYDTGFLKAFCQLAMEQDISRVCLTPWKSFLVKEITAANRQSWEILLGQFGINMRHSSLEMNWHLPVLDQQALGLKRFLIKHFDQNDISTYGLSFTVKTKPMVTWTSVIIERQSSSAMAGAYDLSPTYQVYHTQGFDPNQETLVPYATDVFQEDLPPLLMNLSKYYVEQLTQIREGETEKIVETPVAQEEELETIHQCPHCYTVYEPRYGDPAQGVAEGTPFEELPTDYACGLCETPVQEFVTLERKASLSA